MTRDQLLHAWEALPELQRQAISKRGANLNTAHDYFILRNGVKLTMEELQQTANATERWDDDAAGAGASYEDDSTGAETDAFATDAEGGGPRVGRGRGPEGGPRPGA